MRHGIADEHIPIRDATGRGLGALRRVTEREAADPAVLADLTAWRNANRKFFLTRFEASAPRTAEWLHRVVLPDPARAFFLIDDENGTAIGQLGVLALGTESPELDNMIRGRSGGDPQLMYWAEVALIDRVFRDPGVRSIGLQVFSNNWIPIGIHRTIGFEPGVVRKLSRATVGEEEHLLLDSPEGEPLRFGYLRMDLGREAFEAFRSGKTSWSR